MCGPRLWWCRTFGNALLMTCLWGAVCWAYPRPIDLGIVGDRSADRRLLATLVFWGHQAGDTVRVSWECRSGNRLSRSDTTLAGMDGRIATSRKWFDFEDGAGEVCATVHRCERDTCLEQEVCLALPVDSLSGKGAMRTGRVVREEMIEHGRRYRTDEGVWVPVAKSERLLGGEIRVRGRKAAVLEELKDPAGAGEGTLLRAIVCVDSTGAVTRIMPSEHLDASTLQKLTHAVEKLRFTPGFVGGRRVADWVEVRVRIP